MVRAGAASGGRDPAPRLGPSAYVVLGLIAELGPSTPYDLKRAVSRSVAYFWDFPHSQLYVEPERLARLGLLTEVQEDHGRRRRLFSITPAGREAVEEWLAAPTREQTEVRDLGLLKLYFAGMAGPERIRQMAQEQIALHEERLAEYDALSAEMAHYDKLRPHQVPIRMGYLHEQAWIAFWQSVVDDPPAVEVAGDGDG